MQPELEIITKEIPAKGKGYMWIRRCWPDQVDGLILLGAYIYGDYPDEDTLTRGE